MTTDEFIDQRTEELRRFFQGRFGVRWLKVLRIRLGRGHALNFFINRVRPSAKALRPVEALAISLGFKPTRLDLPPRERKKLARLANFKASIDRQLVLPGAVDDESLWAMTRHKLRARPLRDDVFPEEFLAHWCEVDAPVEGS